MSLTHRIGTTFQIQVGQVGFVTCSVTVGGS